MSFFRSTPSNPPAASYNRIQDGSDYQTTRSPRRPAPPSAQYNPPQNPYNDPSSALFEKPRTSRKAPPPSSGGMQVLFMS